MDKNGKLRVSRRDFLRIAGVSAGVAAVAVTSKPAAAKGNFSGGTFSDAAGRPNRPWWVRTVDEPTTEVDWDMMERYNERTGTVRGPGMAGYVGDDEVDRLSAVAAENELQRMLDKVDGYTLKDQALGDAHVGVGRSFLGPERADTPEERGVPKWTGSPQVDLWRRSRWQRSDLHR